MQRSTTALVVPRSRFVRSPRQTDLGVLHDHIAVLRAELARVTRRRLAVRMRTETSTLALRTKISWLNIHLAEAYIEQAGASGGHSTECAINQAPAFRPGPCNCVTRRLVG